MDTETLESRRSRPVSDRQVTRSGQRQGLEDAMTTTTTMGSFYDEKRAASELRKYREKGPIPSTQALIEALEAEEIEGMTLLDIGGGIGAIQHGLLDAGVAHATCVDASAPYLDAAREESRRRGHDGRVAYVHGDFVELADSIPPADIVTLDRVINVYPGWEGLVGLAAARAERLLGLVYPRDTRMVRLVVFAMNLHLRRKGTQVRAAIRPGDAIERIARENGLAPHVAQDVGPAWHVAVFRRA
jgi:2-polyprenyl-3-methyl-5-hydroxy-6-metoxy-1,4-benzoquinol methylase